jgi:hypothetical protein
MTKPCAHSGDYDNCAICDEYGYEPPAPDEELLAWIAKARERGIDYSTAESMLYAAWYQTTRGTSAAT